MEVNDLNQEILNKNVEIQRLEAEVNKYKGHITPQVAPNCQLPDPEIEAAQLAQLDSWAARLWDCSSR